MSTTTTINKATVNAGAKNLANLLENVLAQVVSSYASYTMPLPSRQYFTMGEPALDCEQVVVSFLQMYVGSPGDEANQPRRCNDPRSATLNVTVTRSIPVVGQNGRPPSAETIQNAAEIIAYDAYILLDSAAQLDTWEAGGFGLGVIATVESRSAEGGLQSTVLTLTTAIP
jgi:hypothetical protein